MELEDSYTYLKVVAFDGVPLENVVQDLSTAEYCFSKYRTVSAW